MLIKDNLPPERDIRIPPILLPEEVGEAIPLEDSRKDYGRTPGSNNIPPFLRNTIAVAAHKDKTKNVAKAFGVSPQEVSLIKHAKIPDGKDEFGRDRVNPDSDINTGIREAVETDLLKVRKIATEKLLIALASVTEDRIKLIPKVTEVIHVADGLSRIVERTIPKDLGVQEAAKFVFIIPESRRTMDSYQVLEVEATGD